MEDEESVRYVSTAGQAPAATLDEAIWRGLAPDGGLYMPESIPELDQEFWTTAPERGLPETAAALLKPYLEDEMGSRGLGQLVAEALSFPIPLVQIEERVWLLELFHGPTLAFKDVGARFLARLLALRRPTSSPATVLVATSGDTGGAVANAFFRLPGMRVVVLYPEGKVSPSQERQFATLGENVRAVAVVGTFDDCQRLAKAAFADRELCLGLHLTSANSINLGRLLPQMVYYAHALAQLPEQAGGVVFSTPSGNFGNLTAGLIAERMGMPCRRFVAATNANDVVPQYLLSGVFQPRPSRPTLANAMDVGNPSNLARIRHLFADDVPAMRNAIWTSSHLDDEIRETIQELSSRRGVVLDPHTAVGYLALCRFQAQGGTAPVGIVLATAHPAKFRAIVEPLIERPLELPESLAECLERPLQVVRMEPRLEPLRELLRGL